MVSKKSKNIALIFARGGSKGIKMKNIKLLNGKPLIKYTIDTAIKSKIYSHIFVSTDNQKIAEIAISSGIEVINRPKNLATDTSPEIESWRHAINYLYDKKISFRKVSILPATSPLRSITDLKNGIRLLDKKTDIVISVTDTDRHPYFNMVRIDNNGYVDIAIKKKNIYRRQDAPRVFNMTTVVYVTTGQHIKKMKNLFSGRVKALKIPVERAIDIDTIYDFKVAGLLLKNKSNLL